MNQLTFMVVEDHDFQRNMLVKMLKSMRAKQVHAAADGRAALDLMKSLSAPLDIIISDVDMPAMDGLEFLRHIGLGRYGTSLIIASALDRNLLSSIEDMATAYRITFLGTIEKPVTPRKLEELVQLHQPRAKPSAQPIEKAVQFSADEIVDALNNDEFEPYYQPKIEIGTGRVVGAEALARWQHPQQGTLSPYLFIAPLEAAGKIDMLMRCMLRKSARFCRALREHGREQSISVNVSVSSLREVQVAEQITEIVRQQHVEQDRIVLEITETAEMSDVGKVLENLARLRMKGFQLAIDDYGTGYSSLEQLSRVPFSELKIDQSFVTHAARTESARVILASSLDMARRLKIRAVAEGVETRANWDLLVDLKCDVAQGYYISKPLSRRAYVEWLDAWSQLAESTEGAHTSARA